MNEKVSVKYLRQKHMIDIIFTIKEHYEDTKEAFYSCDDFYFIFNRPNNE